LQKTAVGLTKRYGRGRKGRKEEWKMEERKKGRMEDGGREKGEKGTKETMEAKEKKKPCGATTRSI
jgi:hypothetical protein